MLAARISSQAGYSAGIARDAVPALTRRALARSPATLSLVISTPQAWNSLGRSEEEAVPGRPIMLGRPISDSA